MNSVDSMGEILQEWLKIVMHHSMHNFLAYAKEIKLSMSHFSSLSKISHKGALGVSDIGDELGISCAAASQMLDRLVQQGLITRSEDPKDRRAKQLVLTDRGRQVLQEMTDSRQAWLLDLAATLSPPEREQVAAALNILIEKVNQLDQFQAKAI